MHIVYNSLNITLAVPVVIALIGFVKWFITRYDKKKNTPKPPCGKA